MALEEHSDLLDNLIEQTQDSARGFLSAQSDVTDADLSAKFDELTARRAELVDELQRAARRVGSDSDADEESSPLEALERGWLSIKAAMTIEHDKTDALVLANRVENEDEVLEAYDEALQQSLPPELQQLLRRQRQQIEETREELAQLEEAVRASSDYEQR
ncbi:MAG TPA: PA2169 family four-helix-bundle protein [Candidatus Sulfomarinibacteraceae bacterium]|nr:PA2169 family four-helix-bundle protein [Candidatus Sulfomarinibacteraceae bacterium]